MALDIIVVITVLQMTKLEKPDRSTFHRRHSIYRLHSQCKWVMKIYLSDVQLILFFGHSVPNGIIPNPYVLY